MRACSFRHAVTLVAALVAGLLLGATPRAAAETELGLYLGWQEAERSRVSGREPGGLGDFGFPVRWEGRSFRFAPYWGARVTRWLDDRWGLAVEFNHAKVYSDRAARAGNGFDRLEFTNGLNTLTLNLMHRWAAPGRRTVPYVGLGAGVAVPYVEITTAASRTRSYQVTGPAVAWIAGLSHALSERTALFVEYRGTRSWNRARFGEGGRLETDITTHALNVGLALRF